MGGCAKHLQGTWTDQRQGELLREITLNTMVRINTNKVQYLSCYTNVPKKEEGMFDILMRFTLKTWTCLKMES